MRQQLVHILVLSLAVMGFGRRIEFLRFKQPSQDELIPVFDGIEDFADSFVNSEDEPSDLVLIDPLETTTPILKQSDLGNFKPFAGLPNSSPSNFRSMPIENAVESRNFQPLSALPTDLSNLPGLTTDLPGLPTNLPGLPTFNNPELRNFQTQPQLEDDATSGRTFKHFLLLKSLLGSGSSGSSGSVPAYYPIIVNTPVNVTNWNNNTLTNVPAAAAAAAGDDPGFRIRYVGIPQAQSFPLQMPSQGMAFQMPATQQIFQQQQQQQPESSPVYQQPTPVYHQRQAAATISQPAYAVAMLNIPGTTSFMPFPFQPQYQSMNRDNQQFVRRTNALNWSNASPSKQQSPWSAFANNLRGLQFL